MNLDNIFNIDTEKAIEVILYIASRAPAPDIYHVCKILYFADKEHLEGFGRQICGDSYVAMKDGPVPSAVYDLLKDVRGGQHFAAAYEHASKSFSVENGGNHNVSPLRDANLDLLSESDIECLDASIGANGKLKYGQLRNKSHDAAYESADRNSYISLESILDTLPSGEELKSHLLDPFPG